MKITKLLFVLVLAAFFSSCEDDSSAQENNPQLEVITVTDLHAPGDVVDRQTGQVTEKKDFVRFSFEEGGVTTSDHWDIAFKGTTIAINGGSLDDDLNRNGDAAAAMESGIFEGIAEAPADAAFSQDSDASGYAVPKGSDNGWYNYNPQSHLITPVPGRVLVFRTHDGKYAKVEVLNYYKGSPENPDAFSDQSATYTFRYVYRENGSKEF